MQIEIPEATAWGAIVAGVGFWAVTAWRVTVRFTEMQARLNNHDRMLEDHAELIRSVTKVSSESHTSSSKLQGLLEGLLADMRDVKQYIMRDK